MHTTILFMILMIASLVGSAKAAEEELPEPTFSKGWWHDPNTNHLSREQPTPISAELRDKAAKVQEALRRLRGDGVVAAAEMEALVTGINMEMTLGADSLAALDPEYPVIYGKIVALMEGRDFNEFKAAAFEYLDNLPSEDMPYYDLYEDVVLQLLQLRLDVLFRAHNEQYSTSYMLDQLRKSLARGRSEDEAIEEYAEGVDLFIAMVKREFEDFIHDERLSIYLRTYAATLYLKGLKRNEDQSYVEHANYAFNELFSRVASGDEIHNLIINLADLNAVVPESIVDPEFVALIDAKIAEVPAEFSRKVLAFLWKSLQTRCKFFTYSQWHDHVNFGTHPRMKEEDKESLRAELQELIADGGFFGQDELLKMRFDNLSTEDGFFPGISKFGVREIYLAEALDLMTEEEIAEAKENFPTEASDRDHRFYALRLRVLNAQVSQGEDLSGRASLFSLFRRINDLERMYLARIDDRTAELMSTIERNHIGNQALFIYLMRVNQTDVSPFLLYSYGALRKGLYEEPVHVNPIVLFTALTQFASFEFRLPHRTEWFATIASLARNMDQSQHPNIDIAYITRLATVTYSDFVKMARGFVDNHQLLALLPQSTKPLGGDEDCDDCVEFDTSPEGEDAEDESEEAGQTEEVALQEQPYDYWGFSLEEKETYLAREFPEFESIFKLQYKLDTAWLNMVPDLDAYNKEKAPLRKAKMLEKLDEKLRNFYDPYLTAHCYAHWLPHTVHRDMHDYDDRLSYEAFREEKPRFQLRAPDPMATEDTFDLREVCGMDPDANVRQTVARFLAHRYLTDTAWGEGKKVGMMLGEIPLMLFSSNLAGRASHPVQRGVRWLFGKEMVIQGSKSFLRRMVSPKVWLAQVHGGARRAIPHLFGAAVGSTVFTLLHAAVLYPLGLKPGLWKNDLSWEENKENFAASYGNELITGTAIFFFLPMTQKLSRSVGHRWAGLRHTNMVRPPTHRRSLLQKMDAANHNLDAHVLANKLTSSQQAKVTTLTVLGDWGVFTSVPYVERSFKLKLHEWDLLKADDDVWQGWEDFRHGAEHSLLVSLVFRNAHDLRMGRSREDFMTPRKLSDVPEEYRAYMETATKAHDFYRIVGVRRGQEDLHLNAYVLKLEADFKAERITREEYILGRRAVRTLSLERDFYDRFLAWHERRPSGDWITEAQALTDWLMKKPRPEIETSPRTDLIPHPFRFIEPKPMEEVTDY